MDPTQAPRQTPLLRLAVLGLGALLRRLLGPGSPNSAARSPQLCALLHSGLCPCSSGFLCALTSCRAAHNRVSFRTV